MIETVHARTTTCCTHETSIVFLLQKEVKEWMKFFDTNKDGKVHVDEYFSLPKSHQSYWDKVDINNDE